MRNDQNTPNVQQWYNNKKHWGETQHWVPPGAELGFRISGGQIEKK
jgi:hypothetical protein